MAKTDMPSLIFKIKNRLFSIDTADVITIFTIVNRVTPVPGYPHYLRGIIDLRKTAVPMLEVRALLQLETLSEEFDAFDAMLEQRKEDHVRWVRELERCVEEDKEFSLAIDPHKCAFGKWYDAYKSESDTVQFHLHKIEQPHKELHECAERVFHCRRECDKCERKICLRDALHQAAHQYMPIVVGLLNEAKAVFRENSKEMCIVIQNEETTFGMIVDAVVAVEDLTQIGSSKDIGGIQDLNIVQSVCKGNDISGEILSVNLGYLTELVRGEPV